MASNYQTRLPFAVDFYGLFGFLEGNVLYAYKHVKMIYAGRQGLFRSTHTAGSVARSVGLWMNSFLLQCGTVLMLL